MRAIFSKIKHFCIQTQDNLITSLMYVLPCATNWFYHLKIKKDIQSYALQDNSGKKATLYQHGKWISKPKKTQAVIILHGLYAHPFIMLHLAEIAQKTNIGPVFSFYVSYDEVNLEPHRELLKQAMDSIEDMLRADGYSLEGIVMLGHSMGAIEAAYRAFVCGDKRVVSVISIAGRLKVVETINSPCRESLKSSLNQIYEGVRLHPYLPLFQIVGRNDWNAPLESTLIRKDKGYYHIVENAMHFDILFHQDLQQKIPEFLLKTICV